MMFWVVLISLMIILIWVDRKNNSVKIDRVVEDIQNKARYNQEKAIRDVTNLKEHYTCLIGIIGDDNDE